MLFCLQVPVRHQELQKIPQLVKRDILYSSPPPPLIVKYVFLAFIFIPHNKNDLTQT